MKIKSTL